LGARLRCGDERGRTIAHALARSHRG
jgi:hypothetical protein